MPVFIIIFVAVGLLLVGVALPLIQRRVKPNDLYGLRVAATFADEWVWYEANARTGRDFLVAGLVQVGVALLLPLSPLVSEQAYVICNLVVLVVAVLFVAAIGWKRANRLLQERRSTNCAA